MVELAKKWGRALAATVPVAFVYWATFRLWMWAYPTSEGDVAGAAATAGITIFIAFLISGEFAKRGEQSRVEKTIAIELLRDIDRRATEVVGGLLELGRGDFGSVVRNFRSLRRDLESSSKLIAELGLLASTEIACLAASLGGLSRLLTDTPRLGAESEEQNRVSDQEIVFGKSVSVEARTRLMALRLDFFRLVSRVNRA